MIIPIIKTINARIMNVEICPFLRSDKKNSAEKINGIATNF